MVYWDSEIQKGLIGHDKKMFLSKKQIIKYLYRNGTLSGAKIAKKLNLSSPTTQSYLNELIKENIIEYRGKGKSIGGRRPNIYGLVKNSVYLLGIDISQNKFSVAIYNNELQNISGIQTKSLKLGNDLSAIDTIYEFAKALLIKFEIEEKKIMGVGINMPGLIDSDSGINYSYLYAPDVCLRDAFQEKFKFPVYIENDSKARALAELRYGIAKESKNALVLQLDWGLGIGMIFNGKLYKGNSGFSGEFSHILINDDGPLCICGKRGCLETIASGRVLVSRAYEELDKNVNSALHQSRLSNNGQLTPDDIVKAAKEGDQLALSLINSFGQNLGKGLSYLIQILNPELIILGGTISQANEYLLTPINQSLFSYCIPKLREDTSIKISQLGIESGVLGAVSVVLEHAINDY
ncbi:ROK family transcriptional regulator [Labilibaculum sp.]|uniref:ROK family transcriptional regulator n=1 Tax=Labilibaculum sp. TaxID=2060723 RepID=UPI003564887A